MSVGSVSAVRGATTRSDHPILARLRDEDQNPRQGQVRGEAVKRGLRNDRPSRKEARLEDAVSVTISHENGSGAEG